MRIVILFLLLAILPPTSAKATTYFEETITCPIGGKKFKAMQIGSYTSWGQQPDGMDIGTLGGPAPLAECPDNGLVLFEEFDKQTIEKLKPLIAGPEFQALRKSETQRYRIWWLLNKLGRDERDLAWVLVTASWEAKNDPPKRRLYQTQYVQAITQISQKGPDDWDWVYLQGRAANAMRELGDFGAARTLISKLPLTDLAVSVPNPIVDRKSKGTYREVSNQDAINVAENRNSWVPYFKKLSVLIENQVISAMPVTMVPDEYAAIGCTDNSSSLTAFEKQYCEKPEMKKLSDEYLETRARWKKEEAEEASKPPSTK
jgi:hypothetical protein